MFERDSLRNRECNQNLCNQRDVKPRSSLRTLFNHQIRTLGGKNSDFSPINTIRFWAFRKVHITSYKITQKFFSLHRHFKAKYPKTRVILDCTELKCQMPISLLLNSRLFSSYKNHTTVKGLVGIAPAGAITFPSQLYSGSISDREIVERSGILDLPFDDGDSVMADKGFTIEDLLPLGVSLNISPFLGHYDQMPPEGVVKTQVIAALRIHVERAITKLKISTFGTK